MIRKLAISCLALCASSAFAQTSWQESGPTQAAIMEAAWVEIEIENATAESEAAALDSDPPQSASTKDLQQRLQLHGDMQFVRDGSDIVHAVRTILRPVFDHIRYERVAASQTEMQLAFVRTRHLSVNNWTEISPGGPMSESQNILVRVVNSADGVTRAIAIFPMDATVGQIRPDSKGYLRCGDLAADLAALNGQ